MSNQQKIPPIKKTLEERQVVALEEINEKLGTIIPLLNTIFVVQKTPNVPIKPVPMPTGPWPVMYDTKYDTKENFNGQIE